ncbi:cytochrome P450 3A8-like isoform X1 [Dermacentor variabilis]|uniref:cytochrome P450 3A8-like isoform X1 n=1 Tax=Dermacentor variabilis TaxID=34621 RepID=UPI003F5B7D0E
MELIGLPDWLLLAATAVILFYLYAARNRNYWKKQNIAHEDFSLVIGPAMRIFFKPFHEIDDQRYKKYGRVFGIYEGGKPTLLVGEPELVKQVLVKDFPLLSNRRPLQFFDPILDNMMSIAPVERWRKIRPSASPAFTTGKLRRMNELIQACAEITSEHLKNAAQQKKDIDVKQFYGHYALDVIARCAFGTKLDSHTDATNEFVTKARKAFSSGVTLPLLMLFLFPGLMKALKVKAFNSEIFEYFKDVSVNIIQKRKDKHHRQEDFLQLMMDAQEGALHETAESTPGKESAEIFNLDSEVKNDITFISKALSEDEALAQCVLFFLAGHDTTSSVLSYAAYLLALNPEVQAKLRMEVDECIASHGNEPSLDVVSKLPYLHCVVSEVLRMYPPAPRLERSAHEDYVLGDTGIRVPKGCVIGVPVYSMHHDSEFFPSPETFDPDRFSEENVGSIRPYSYLPFGAGPRNCIGMRFALQAVKLSLLHSIHSVQLVPTEKTEVPLKFLPGLGLMNAKNVTVGIRERPER